MENELNEKDLAVISYFVKMHTELHGSNIDEDAIVNDIITKLENKSRGIIEEAVGMVLMLPTLNRINKKV